MTRTHLLPRDAAAIAGIGQTEFSRRAGRTELQLASEAIAAACADASPSSVMSEARTPDELCERLATHVAAPPDRTSFLREARARLAAKP